MVCLHDMKLNIAVTSEDSCFNLQAAHAVLQLQETGKPVYKVKNVSLNALCELYNAPINPMKEQVSLNIVKQLLK